MSVVVTYSIAPRPLSSPTKPVPPSTATLSFPIHQGDLNSLAEALGTARDALNERLTEWKEAIGSAEAGPKRRPRSEGEELDEEEDWVRNAGKFGKAKRGGGRHFSRDLSRLDADGNSTKPSTGDDSSSEESSSEEEDDTNPQDRIGQLPPIADSDSEEDTSGLAANLNSTLSTAPAGPSASKDQAPLRVGQKLTADQVAEARKARKAMAKKGGGPWTKKPANGSSSEEESEEENENLKAGKNLKVSDLGAPREMSRREREQAEKLAAKERYAKLHAAGKTDEAKADLGRLAEIRKQRELAAARRKAEAEAAAAASKAALEKSGKKVPLKR